jgi:hypothetical protein
MNAAACPQGDARPQINADPQTNTTPQSNTGPQSKRAGLRPTPFLVGKR